MNYSGTIALRAENGMYVSALNGGGQYLIANRQSVDALETFQLVDCGNGQVALQTSNGMYVCAEDGGGQPLMANSNTIGAGETFTLINRGDNNIALLAVNGQYVCAEAEGDQYLIVNGNIVSTWATFELINIATNNIIIREATEPPRASIPNVLVFDGMGTYCCAQLDVSESAYTVSIWFKTTNKNCGIFSVDAGEQGASGNDRHIYLNDGAICARIWNNETIKGTRNTFADGTWHRVTHVFGGAIGGQRIYVDGQLEATGTKTSSDFNWQDGINIGFSNDANNVYFEGEISEVTIWSIARTEVEIIATNELLAGNENGLLAYWNFKDGKENTITDRTANKIILTIKGKADWQQASDFSGVFAPVVHPEVIAAINHKAQQLSAAPPRTPPPLKPVISGNPNTATASPVSQLNNDNSLVQYEAVKRLYNAMQDNTLTFTEDLLGDFSGVFEIVSNILNPFITIHDPKVDFVKITPGTSGADGEPFSNDLTADVNLATAESAALHISGETFIFWGLNVQLKYAEFSQFKGSLYGILKFLINSPLSLASILPNVPLLEGMVISNPVIILSSIEDIEDNTLNNYLLSASLADTNIVDGTLTKGFNFFGGFKLGESADKRLKFIGDFLGVQDIVLHGAANVTPGDSNYKLDAAIPIDIYIVDGSNFKLRFSKAMLGVVIKGEPLEPAIIISNEMVVTLVVGSDKTDLVFTGGIELAPTSVTGSFTMQVKSDQPYVSASGNVVASGEWKNPFGIPGITIRELAMQVGFTYEEPWIDNVGVHGNIQIGDIDGSISVLVDVTNPSQFVLAGATDHITIVALMSCMSEAAFITYQALPFNIKQMIDHFINLSLDNVKIYIVPTTASIGAINFEQGVTVKGTMNAWGWQAAMLIKVDYTEGLEVHGDMDNINISNVFKITGAQSNGSPQLSLTLSPETAPDFAVSGSVYLLGFSQDTLIKVNQSGFVFYFERSMYNNAIITRLNCSFGDGGNLVASGTTLFILNFVLHTPFGDIPLSVSFDAATNLQVGPKYGFVATFSGSFAFHNHNIAMPALTITVAPSDFSGIYTAVQSQINKNAGVIFKPMFNTLNDWANAVNSGIIVLGITSVASVAKNVYAAGESDVITAYKTLNMNAYQIAYGFRDAYGYSGQAITNTLKGADYAADQVSVAIKSAYSFSEGATAAALKNAGYDIYQIGDGIKSAYNLTATATATALNGAGYAVTETGNYVKTAYGLTADELNTALQDAGYAAKQVGGYLQTLGDTFTSLGNTVMGGVTSAGNTVKDGVTTIENTVKNTTETVINKANPKHWF